MYVLPSMLMRCVRVCGFFQVDVCVFIYVDMYITVRVYENMVLYTFFSVIFIYPSILACEYE